MKKGILKIFLSFLLLVQSMIFQVSAPQLVLCIGEEGHVAIEVADEKHAEEGIHHFEQLFNKSSAEHHFSAQSCIDIPLDYHFGSSHISDKKSIESLPVIFGSYFTEPLTSLTYAGSGISQNKSPINSHLAVTVLLI